ncbi:MAG: hypothetical protein ACOWWR_07955 [Eubacteriales bacterium]
MNTIKHIKEIDIPTEWKVFFIKKFSGRRLYDACPDRLSKVKIDENNIKGI